MASGRLLLFLDHDDELCPDALYEVVRAANTGAELMYSDESLMDRDSVRTDCFYKPKYNPDLLLDHNISPIWWPVSVISLMPAAGCGLECDGGPQGLLTLVP